ncbi:hypothetical protein FRC01_006945, partial [Tulasnella sp. 417]
RSIFASLNSDLFGWIFNPNTRRDFISVALTSQAFTEVALDILYHRVDFHNLLQVWHARGILRQIRPPSAESQEIGFVRVPNAPDYRRLMYYSRRVRRLSVSCQNWRANRYSTTFFPTFIEVITGRSTEQAELFPQLRSLTWKGPGELELAGCEAIIQASPRLKEFTYMERPEDPQSSADSWPTLLHTLASVQSLERIDLGWRMSLGPAGPSTRAGLALARLITKPNVKELELPDHVVTSSVVVSSLVSARQLEKLTFWPWIKPITAGAEVPRTASSDRLSYLGGTPRGMKPILAGASVFRALTAITSSDIGGDTAITWSFVRTFVDLVGNGCPVLKTLVLSGFVDEDPVEQRARFVLAPLRACTRMHRFSFLAMARHGPVSVPLDFNPTDSDWRYLISEWPDLQHFSYSFSGGYELMEYDPSLEPKPRATINTLVEFSRNCRQLVKLVLSLNATSQVTDAALLGEILPFGNSMKFINFLGGSIEDDAVEGLATLLLRLTRDDVGFHPGTRHNLDSMEEDGFDMSSERNWLAAKKLIDFTRKVRPLGTPSEPKELSLEDLFGTS